MSHLTSDVRSMSDVTVDNGQFSQRDEFQISWIRHSDLHILTVGRYTYTAGIEITELFILEGFSIDVQNCTQMCSLFSLDI